MLENHDESRPKQDGFFVPEAPIFRFIIINSLLEGKQAVPAKKNPCPLENMDRDFCFLGVIMQHELPDFNALLDMKNALEMDLLHKINALDHHRLTSGFLRALNQVLLDDCFILALTCY